MRLVLIHGWGFDARAWVPFCEALVAEFAGEPSPPRIFVHDFGFFGGAAPARPEGEGPLIAIGHSLGFLWLLKERPFAWDGLVSIAGFPRFTAAPSFPLGVAERVVSRMERRLEEEPERVLTDFYRNCGLETAPPPGYEPTRLAEGLSWLRKWDAVESFNDEEKPMLALTCPDDAILPFALSRSLFESRDGTTFVTPSDESPCGHALPLLRPKWCAEQVWKFVRSAV